MKSFTYTIKEEQGMHARPAGLLAKEAKAYTSKITIHAGEKKAEATKLIAVMGLGVKCGQTVTIEVDGADEDKAVEDMKVFFENNF